MDRCWIMAAFIVLAIYVRGNNTCPDDRFTCSNGQCVSWSRRCNGASGGCSEGSDEDGCKNNTCPNGRFTCSNGQCVSWSWRCDGNRDCLDGSDEDGCENNTCPVDWFTCSNGQCVSWSWRCDGDRDCLDGSDEDGCENNTCPNEMFTCSNGQCVWWSWRCDGDGECLDGSDEDGCGDKTCFYDRFTCYNGLCVLQSWRCDGRGDCIDGSDEDGCENYTCGDNVFACSIGHCLSWIRRCDGSRDCSNGSDEDGCENNTCPDDFFTCSNGQCASWSSRCDGIWSCTDVSDEDGCENNTCPDDWFTCSNGQCVYWFRHCNGYRDCLDGSDEDGCDCGPLQNPDNGEVSYSPDTHYGATATYTCISGYVITKTNNSTGKRKCHDSGNWTGTDLSCSKRDCGYIQSPKDGVISYSPDTLFEATATYTCMFGFVITNTNHSTGIGKCQNTGTWTGTHLTCSKKDCGSLQSPDDGVVSYNPDTLFEATATYTCINGYVITNTSNSIGTRTCQNTGSWTRTQLTCSKRDCGNLTNPDNGQISYTETTYEAQAIYTCDPGYIVSGTLSSTRTITCTAAGTCSITDTTCTDIGVVIGLIATICIAVAVIVGVPVLVCCIRKNKQRSQRVRVEAQTENIEMAEPIERVHEEMPDNYVNIQAKQDQTSGNNSEYNAYDDTESSYIDLVNPTTAESYNNTDLATKRDQFSSNGDQVDGRRLNDKGIRVSGHMDKSSYSGLVNPTTSESHDYTDLTTRRNEYFHSKGDEVDGRRPDDTGIDVTRYSKTGQDESSSTGLANPTTAESHDYTDLTEQSNQFYSNVGNIDVRRSDEQGIRVTGYTTTGQDESSFTDLANPTTAESHDYTDLTKQRNLFDSTVGNIDVRRSDDKGIRVAGYATTGQDEYSCTGLGYPATAESHNYTDITSQSKQK